jgi:hypothetical protein
MTVRALSASRMESFFIEDPDTGDGLSRAHAPSRSDRLPEQRVYCEKELAELQNQVQQWQLPFVFVWNEMVGILLLLRVIRFLFEAPVTHIYGVSFPNVH